MKINMLPQAQISDGDGAGPDDSALEANSSSTSNLLTCQHSTARLSMAIGLVCVQKQDRTTVFHAYGPIDVGVGGSRVVSMRRFNFFAFCLLPSRGSLESFQSLQSLQSLSEPQMNKTPSPSHQHRSTPCHDFSLAHCALLTISKQSRFLPSS